MTDKPMPQEGDEHQPPTDGGTGQPAPQEGEFDILSQEIRRIITDNKRFLERLDDDEFDEEELKEQEMEEEEGPPS